MVGQNFMEALRMLMLRLELWISPGHAPLPAHLGGVLHGFVEGGVKNHAPHLLPVMRPNGNHQAAHFMILPPPAEAAVGECLSFAIILYSACGDSWPVLLRALLEQQTCGLNNRRIRIDHAWCVLPGGDAYELLEQGQLLRVPDGIPMARDVAALADKTPSSPETRGWHRLSFRAPLLLASRKAQRNKAHQAEGLPWPPLGSVLDSIADRMRALEPRLAAALNLTPDWSAPKATRQIVPFTTTTSPARQVTWDYTSTPRQAYGEEQATPPQRRTLSLPGIVGDLVYPAAGIEHEHALLYWGQWLGVGQKTTLGCGSYALTSQ